MADRIFLGPGGLPPVGRPQPQQPGPRRPGGPGAAGGTGFGQALDEALARESEPVRLSAHAAERLRASGRTLTPEEAGRISQAVDKAAAKGARESLLLLDDLALVVSIRNRTVITAVSGERMKENLFTNIDSAVIL